MPTTTNYIWDEDNLLAEADGANTINTVYTNEPQRFGNLVSTRIANTTSYHHFDAMGSTRQLTNGMAHVTDTLISDAWGNLVSHAGSATTSFLWIGQLGYYFDIETSSFWVRRRPYGAGIARWTLLDPAGFIDTLNQYLYAMNGPVVHLDPSGLDPCDATAYGPDAYPCSITINWPDGKPKKINAPCAVRPIVKPGKPACDPSMMVPIPAECTEDCESLIYTLKASDPVVTQLFQFFDDIRKKHPNLDTNKLCPIPSISCVACTGTCSAPGGIFLFPNVYICLNHNPSYNAIVDTLRHELTHAYQRCRDNIRTALGTPPTISTCQQSLRNELQANLCAGILAKDFKAALCRAVWSATFGSCTKEQLDTEIPSLEQWYEQYKDVMCKFPVF